MKGLIAVLLAMTSLIASAMEYTKGFAIQTPSGEHVGFVLAAPTFNAQSGDCVFMLMPKDPGLVESPLGIVISERKVAGEHHWEKRGSEIRISVNGKLVLGITEAGQLRDVAGKVLGKVVAIPESE